MCNNLLSKSYRKAVKISNSNIEKRLLKNVSRCQSVINLGKAESIESTSIVFLKQNIEINTKDRIRLLSFINYNKEEEIANN
jgi:hypothetical protein